MPVSVLNKPGGGGAVGMAYINRPISLFLLFPAVVAISNPYWKQIGRAAKRLFGGAPAV